MTTGKQMLLDVLRDAKILISRPGNDFVWSEWDSASAALAEIQGIEEQIANNDFSRLSHLELIFAPTGAMLELSIASGRRFGVRRQIVVHVHVRKEDGLHPVVIHFARWESRLGDPTPERGGRAKRYFTVTKHGRAALIEAQRSYRRLLEGLDLWGGAHA